MASSEATIASAANADRLSVRPLTTYLALLGGVFGISFTAIFTKWAAVPGPVAGAYRMTIAACILAVPFALRLAGRRRALRSAAATGNSAAAVILPWPVAGIAGLGGVWFGVNLAFLSSALLLTSAATATLLDNTAPIWVGIGAVLLFHERLGGRYWLGLALALTGAAVVSGLNPSHSFVFQRGDLLAFVGAIFYAAYLLTTQRARSGLDTVSTLWLIEAGAAITLLVLVAVMGLPLTGYPLRSYLALVGVAVISQTVGWLLINYALGYLPASSAVVALLAQPIITSLLSIPLLGEGLAWHQIAGGVLVLTGIYLCVRQNMVRSQ
ncbi:MAG TPA: DMT family transporter [Anaerolineae bacterium]